MNFIAFLAIAICYSFYGWLFSESWPVNDKAIHQCMPYLKKYISQEKHGDLI